MNTAFLNVWWALAPMGILIGAIRLFLWQQDRSGKRSPVRDRLLQPPGETLRRQLCDLDFRLLERFALFVMLSACLPATLKEDHSTALFGQVPTLLPATLLAGLGWLAINMISLIKQHRNYHLGFNGERHVGEYLNKLLSHGCHVYHGFPAKPIGNIDHIVVAPTGVFAIETKARSKGGKALPGRLDYQVVFDGDVLDFPNGSDKEDLQQAERNARWLADYLTKATGEPVKVAPILALPGWYVERQGKGRVHVLNPKEIQSVILATRGPKLPEESITRICHQLDQKCRDVDF